MEGVETVNGEDPTQGDVVREIEDFGRKVAHSTLAVVLAPCAHCGHPPHPPHPAMAGLVHILTAALANRNAEWSSDLAAIARRERARRAKRS